MIGVGQDITQIREIDKKQERVADDLSRLMTARTPNLWKIMFMAWSQSGTVRRLRFLDTM